MCAIQRYVIIPDISPLCIRIELIVCSTSLILVPQTFLGIVLRSATYSLANPLFFAIFSISSAS
jgi:hypothetical protein